MRWLLVLALCISACSNGAEADLPAITGARSLGAEWALVNEEAGRGRLTATYVRSMRRSLREQLKVTAASLSRPASPYGREIDALLALPDDASPEDLRAHVRALKQVEANLESA